MFLILLRLKRSVAARFRARLDTRKELPQYQTWQRILHLSLAAVVVALAVVLFPRPQLFVPPDFPREGDIATEDIIAPFDFPVLKSGEELEEERERVERQTPPVLAFDRVIADSVQRTVSLFFDYAERLAESSISERLRSERLAQQFPWIDQSDLPSPRTGGGWMALRYAVEDVIRREYTAGIFPDSRFLPASQSPFVIVLRPNLGDFPLQREQILDMPRARQRIEDELAEVPGVDSLERQRLVTLMHEFLAPNLTYDHETTEQRRQAALDEVRPYKIRIFRGERIVAQNERVSAAHVERLEALSMMRAEQRDEDNPLAHLIPFTARILFAAFCVVGVAVHFAYFRPRYLRRTAVVLLLVVLWSVILIAARYAVITGGSAMYLIPIPFAAIVVTILLDLGTGLVATVFLSMLIGVVAGFEFNIFFSGLAAGMVSAYSVRTVRRRYDFYRPALYGALVYVAAIALIEALRYSSPQAILAACGYGVVNAIAGSILAVGLLPVFESLFGFTTDLTLLELSNFNHPLLRRLSLEAPGTYHHSIVIGNLAEAAAESIGANSLLARVGSYYHDIGKMEKPEYFAENLPHFKNKHENLTPTMSALILESHVKGGKDLALEFDLPDAVIDFIEQHHGTTTMSFFYHKARMQNPDDPVTEQEFRYPGPRPQTRETAIVMLADTVEAVSRTLEDPRPGRLQAAIKKVITDKFLAGQLDECNLTLKDLNRIEESFLKILLGVFHTRVSYPGGDPAGGASGEADETASAAEDKNDSQPTSVVKSRKANGPRVR